MSQSDRKRIDPTRWHRVLGLCASMAFGFTSSACAPDPNAVEACRPTARTRTAVIVRLAFVRQTPESTSVDGFDLDERVSPNGDVMSCRQTDFTSSTGTPGIDNQLAILLPIVDMMTGGALEGAVQGAINNGQLLLTMTIEGLDNTCNDDEVTLVLQRATGTPFVGADMLLDPGQTFDANREIPPVRVPARIRDGELEAGPFTLPLPIAVLTANFTLNLYHGRIRARLTDDGGMEGLIGGGIDREEFMREVRQLIIPQGLMDQIGGALNLFADLDRDERGRCTRLSTAVRFTARPAFVNP